MKPTFDGVFIAGTCQGPKDIPDSVAHGIAAASKAIQALAEFASPRKLIKEDIRWEPK
jgi:heterodisulfide reductase subunit A2